MIVNLLLRTLVITLVEEYHFSWQAQFFDLWLKLTNWNHLSSSVSDFCTDGTCTKDIVTNMLRDMLTHNCIIHFLCLSSFFLSHLGSKTQLKVVKTFNQSSKKCCWMVDGSNFWFALVGHVGNMATSWSTCVWFESKI